jgi:hypothetical protein
VAVHTQEKNLELEHRASDLAAREIADGSKIQPWRLMGYEGWRAGRVRYGTRQAAGLVQLSGDLASDQFPTLYSWVDRISRIDLAVTARLSGSDDDLGRRSYDSAAERFRALPNAARPSAHCDAAGGYTCYVGDRSSDYFFRLYNKQAECRASRDAAGVRRYENCWRYELEVKGQSALLVARDVQYDETRAADVQAIVWDYAERHALGPVFPRGGGQRLSPGFRRRSDYDTRRAWLAHSVAPAVRWMVEQGGLSDVYDALGLGQPFGQDVQG